MPLIWYTYQVFVWRDGVIVLDRSFDTKSQHASNYAAHLRFPAWVVIKQTGKVQSRNKVKAIIT